MPCSTLGPFSQYPGNHPGESHVGQQGEHVKTQPMTLSCLVLWWTSLFFRRASACDMHGAYCHGCEWRHFGSKQPCVGERMNPRNLLLILAWLSQVPLPAQEEALDAATWMWINYCKINKQIHNPSFYDASMLYKHWSPGASDLRQKFVLEKEIFRDLYSGVDTK